MTKWTGEVIAYIDMLMALFVVFVALAVPPVDMVSASDKPICQMAIDIVWQGTLPTDVDLWVMGPDGRPVGYSAKDGRIFNLVRDDLGTVTDTDEVNSERACARNLQDGEYIVNVHLYSTSTPPPIAVALTVNLVDPSAATMEEVINSGTILATLGQQKTIVRFNLKNGRLVAGSESTLPINLREIRKAQAPVIVR